MANPAPNPESQTTQTEVGHDAGGHSNFPPFDSSTFASQLVWLAITFGALYYFMSKRFLPQVEGVIEARRARIAEDLDEATRRQQEAEESGRERTKRPWRRRAPTPRRWPGRARKARRRIRRQTQVAGERFRRQARRSRSRHRRDARRGDVECRRHRRRGRRRDRRAADRPPRRPRRDRRRGQRRQGELREEARDGIRRRIFRPPRLFSSSSACLSTSARTASC